MRMMNLRHVKFKQESLSGKKHTTLFINITKGRWSTLRAKVWICSLHQTIGCLLIHCLALLEKASLGAKKNLSLKPMHWQKCIPDAPESRSHLYGWELRFLRRCSSQQKSEVAQIHSKSA